MGSPGTPADSEDTLRFAALSGVRPMIETYPLDRAELSEKDLIKNPRNGFRAKVLTIRFWDHGFVERSGTSLTLSPYHGRRPSRI